MVLFSHGMHQLMRYTFLLSVLALANYLNAQTSYSIKDEISREAIPFVKVSGPGLKPQLSDIDGNFFLSDSTANQTITLKAFGYADTTLAINQIVENVIYLHSIYQEVQEVRVTAGENPAHRIIQAAIDRRKENDPLKNNSFFYESYSKFTFDVNREAFDTAQIDLSDTSVYNAMRFFDEQHLFLLESASRRTFLPPLKDKEEIIAYKVSGFKNPIFSTFATEMQSFSFYNEYIKILGKEYVSPIAPGSTKRYLFILEDTVIVNADTTFSIFYRPRKGSNFNGLSGYIYINTKGFAVERVIASPYEQKDFEVQIIQEYAFIENTKWFPSKLSTRIDMKNLTVISSIPDSYLQGKGNTYLRKIDIDPENIKKRIFNNVSVETLEGAGETDSTTWEKLRQYEITEREARTYEMIDSLSEAEKLEQKFDLFSAAISGKIPLGKKLYLDASRLADYNQYEGLRLGAGIENSERLVKFMTIGGYGAYGFKDKAWKYGAYSKIYLNRKQGITWSMNYSEDVTERGGLDFSSDGFNLNSSELFNKFSIQQMDQQRKAEVGLSWNILANIRLQVGANYQRVQLTDSCSYIEHDGALTRNFDQSEISAELTWNIRERVMMLGNTRVSKGTKWPKINLKVIQGISGIYDSRYDYLRARFQIKQEVPVRALGSFTWVIKGDKTLGDAPLLYAQRGQGSGLRFNLSVAETFQTMEPSRFYHTQQAALHTYFKFQAFKTKAKWNEPNIALFHSICYGEFDKKERHSQYLESADKGYYEGGVQFNGLLTSSFVQMGMGVFYRYGSYADVDWTKNIFPKFTLGFNM